MAQHGRRKKRELRKLTVMVPEELLQAALKSSQQSITETVCQALRLITASAAYDGLRKLRGKVKFSLDLDELRRD